EDHLKGIRQIPSRPQEKGTRPGVTILDIRPFHLNRPNHLCSITHAYRTRHRNFSQITKYSTHLRH
ncbi:hypothetical protein BGZ96_005163, partial [Linnemannia gamsii]